MKPICSAHSKTRTPAPSMAGVDVGEEVWVAQLHLLVALVHLGRADRVELGHQVDHRENLLEGETLRVNWVDETHLQRAFKDEDTRTVDVVAAVHTVRNGVGEK